MGTDFLYPSVLASDASAPLGVMYFFVAEWIATDRKWSVSTVLIYQRMITTPHLPTVSHGV